MEEINQVILELPQDVHKLCRTCMSVTDNLLCHDISLMELNKLALAGEMLESCTSLHMYVDDGLPTTICTKCAEQLEIAYNFKSQCERIDSHLRDLLNLPNLKEVRNVSATPNTNVGNSNKCVTVYKMDMHTKKKTELFEDEQKPLVTLLQQRYLESTPNEIQESLLQNVESLQVNEKAEKEIINFIETEGLVERRIRDIIDTSKNVEEPDGYLCVLCNDIFDTPSNLAFHRELCPNRKENGALQKTSLVQRKPPLVDTQISCDLCSKILTSESKLLLHFRRHARTISKELKNSLIFQQDGETITEEDLLSCYICTEKFEDHGVLKNHIDKQHTKTANVQCQICNKLFPGEIRLFKHLQKHGIYTLLCKICLQRFEDINALTEHLFLHGNKKVGLFECPLCKVMFTKIEQLRLHAAVHATDIFECSKCKRAFNNKASCEAHEKQHTEPRFLCSFCGKRYFSKITLACHVRSHNNEKPFICPHCQKAFSSGATLCIHKRIHSNFKPYVCSYCGYSCRQSGDLDMHLRTHTGVKPYKCTFPNCERRFKTPSQRKEHYRRHTNERNHKCVTCGKAFLESKTLKVHLLTHTGEKPHECPICAKKFRRSHHLNNHMKAHRERDVQIL